MADLLKGLAFCFPVTWQSPFLKNGFYWVFWCGSIRV
jgi:hypothetical protein